MRVLGAFLACVLALAGCSTGARASLLVFAAASLTDVFRDIGATFERQHGIAVRFNFGPSNGLATQIVENDAADVFASASDQWMDAAARDPGVIDRTTFARNHLVVIVPASNPASIRGFRDLGRPGVKVVLAADGVPAGTYARAALGKARISEPALANVVSNEEDVKGVVQKIILDEADAGIVYATDVTPAVAARIRVITIPDEHNVVTSYSLGVVRTSKHHAGARAFIRFLLGPGQQFLARAHFLPAR